MEKNSKTKELKVIDIVQVGLMTAIVYVATALIHVPAGVGLVHLGDSMGFLAALLIGKKKGFFASALGMSLFDLLSPYAVWAPFTFVIKGVMAYITAVIAFRGNYKGKSFWNNLLGTILGGIWMIVAYYFAGALIYKSMVVPISAIPGDIAQVVIGIIVSLFLVKVLEKAKFTERFASR